MEILNFDSLEIDLLISSLRHYKVEAYNCPSCDSFYYDRIISLLRKLENLR